MLNKKIINITYRPTWVEIDLAALEYNLSQVRKSVGLSVKIMVTVKADAYGHGVVNVAKRLQQHKVDYLGVASIDEAIILRKNAIKLPILILGAILPDQAEPVLRYNLIATVCTKEVAAALSREAFKKKRDVKVHIKIDTGMSRLGVWHEDAAQFIFKVSGMDRIKIEGIFTHFPLADSDLNFTYSQIELFNRLYSRLAGRVRIPLIHAANSMGILGYKDSHFNLVRPGLMIYGLYPKSDLKITLKPVMSLKTKIVYIKKIHPLRGISYGHTYVAPREITAAILPIGYGDGYPRILSNKASVIVDGKHCRIIGMICMDQIIVDVTEIKNIKIGQEVVLIGRQKNQEISALELAKLSETISYEIVCGIGARVPRIYRN